MRNKALKPGTTAHEAAVLLGTHARHVENENTKRLVAYATPIIYGTNKALPMSDRPDHCADVITKVIDALRQQKLNEASRLPGYIQVIAHNSVVNYFRKWRGYQSEFLDDSDDFFADEDELDRLAAVESQRLLFEALASLPEQDSFLLRKHHMEGIRLTDLAGALGESEQTLRGRAHRARERLREVLAKLLGPEEQ
jgi:RNA polymerase sigma factor (sigma-70 family)